MKLPNHIILDVVKSEFIASSKYWFYNYIQLFKKNIFFFENLSFQKKFLFKKNKFAICAALLNLAKFTISYTPSNHLLILNQQNLPYLRLSAPRFKVKSKLLYSKNLNKETYAYVKKINKIFDERAVKKTLFNFNFKKTLSALKTNKLWSLFDINLLKKEKIYTKLKYSRVPQYDTVSGGIAALLAGFLGFLICEKFGFELADSGDFYILFMYLVFAFFFARIFFKITDITAQNFKCISFKWLILFVQTVFFLFVRRLKVAFAGE